MQIINYEIGRIIRIFPLEDIRPASGLHPPTALRMIAERYGFAHTPELKRSWEESQQEGLRFQLGRVTNRIRTININDFTIYNDGLVATTTTTEDAEIFLDDLQSWVREEFGYKDPNRSTLRTLYMSTMVVEFDSSPDELLKSYSAISSICGESLRQTYGIEIPVQISKLSLTYDRTLATPAWQTLAHFNIERRVNYPYKENRFYCEAPLKTTDHANILQAFDALLSSDEKRQKGNKPLQK